MSAVRKFDHVFVLCTGRNGSVSFARACGHFDNFTSGHETRSRLTGDARLAYPSGHIEADNRLAWFLGRLDRKFGDSAYYVHLVRQSEKVAASYNRRWKHRYSLVSAFNYHILMRPEVSSDAATDMVRTIEENIALFLKDKTHVITIDIEDPEKAFRRFAHDIGAVGDMAAAIDAFSTPSNTSSDKNFREGDGALSYVNEMRTLKNRFLIEKDKARSVELERNRYKRRYNRARKAQRFLVIPYALLLLPISIPLGIYYWTKKRRQQKERESRKLVISAYQTFQEEGLPAALGMLEKAGSGAPPGVQALFRCIGVQQDEEWLGHFNAFMAAQSLPAVSLDERPGGRFERIGFPRMSPVDSPEMVSVVMPAFNASGTIETAMRSILNQTWTNLELLVVDDCSTDDTVAVVERLAAKDDRVRLIRSQVNGGPYVAKNRAIGHARGTVITGHDSDDIALPTRLADQMAPLIADERCQGTLGYMLRLNNNAEFSWPTPIGKFSYDGIFRFASISLLLRKKVLLDELGYWDTVRFGADSEMIARAGALLEERLVRLERPVMLCLDSAEGLTNHSEYGIKTHAGLSPVRAEYSRYWSAWHDETPPGQRFIPFPHHGTARKFDVPAEMTVDERALGPEGSSQ